MILCNHYLQPAGAEYVNPLLFYTGRVFQPSRPGNGNGDSKAPSGNKLFEVRIIDNNYNTYEEVMQITMAALNVSIEEAYTVAWEVDHLGSCVVAEAEYETAEQIAEMIRMIGIEVQVNPVLAKQ